MTGSGTFESYVSIGSSAGATPDGRLSGQPIASDCSPQPYPQVRESHDHLLCMCISFVCVYMYVRILCACMV